MRACQLSLLAVSLACFTAIALAVTCGDLGEVPLTGCSACVAANTTIPSSSGNSSDSDGDSSGDGNRRHLMDRGGNGRGGGHGGGGSNNDGDNSDDDDNDSNDGNSGDDNNGQGDGDNSTSTIALSCTACDDGFLLIPGLSPDSPQRCGCPPGQGANLTGYNNATINNASVSFPVFTCGPCDNDQVPFTPNSGLVPFFNGTDWTLVLSNSTDGQMAIRSRKARLAALMANRGRGRGRGGPGKDGSKPGKGKGRGNGGGNGKGNGSGGGKGNGNGNGHGRGGGHGGGGSSGGGDGRPPFGGNLPWFPGSCVDCPVGSAPNADKTACVAT